MRAPDAAGLGTATATATFDDWKEGRVAPAVAELRVVDGKPGK